MGLRQRKNLLISALKGYALGGRLTQEKLDAFEAMYRRSRTDRDLDQVSFAIQQALIGWHTATDVYSRLRRNASGSGDFQTVDDEDPPALKEALAQSRVTFIRK